MGDRNEAGWSLEADTESKVRSSLGCCESMLYGRSFCTASYGRTWSRGRLQPQVLNNCLDTKKSVSFEGLLGGRIGS